MHLATSATKVTMLWNRDQEWDARMRMIAHANSFLYLSTFYIEWGRYACECLNALIDAQQRGVSTVLVIDRFGQRLGSTQMSRADRKMIRTRLQDLRDAGGKVVMYTPRHPIDQLLGGGQHIKIQASEAGEAIFGSSNLSDCSFAGWNEFSVALRGPIFDVLLENFRGLTGDPTPVAGAPACHSETEQETTPFEYMAFDPNEARGPLGLLGRCDNPISNLLAERIDAAQSQIDITSFYFKPIPLVTKALKNASDRGVRIRVFHSHTATLSSRIPWIASAADYDSLLEHGIEVYENKHGEHSKIILVDNEWAIFGSYNLEDAADFRLAEAMLITEDETVITSLRNIFAELTSCKDNVRVRRAQIDQWSLRTRAAIRIIGPIKRWF
ncbi:MAG: phospholipase D-like domain-containing protein [Rubripirellula sp.]